MYILPLSMEVNQFNAKLWILQSDDVREYLSRNLSSFFDEFGFVHQTTCSSTPKQNSIAKRKNRHIEIACAIMFTMNVPKTWSDAIQIVAYLINRMPTCVLSYKSPLEVFSPNTPSFSLLPNMFGCICYVHVPKFDRTKLDPMAFKCVFLGYCANQKGYKCFHLLTCHKFVSKDRDLF